jgi:methionyl-tRNA formyltransferase
LLRRATSIGDEETAAELTPRLAEMGAELLIEALSGLERGEIGPEPQNDAEATLAPILKREDGEVDWAMTATEIFNRLRGFTPFPGCYTFFNGHRLEIVKARPEPGVDTDKFEPGVVCEAAGDSFVVACGGMTRLRIIEVQLEGKRAMPARDFLNGARLQVGARLGRSINGV